MSVRFRAVNWTRHKLVYDAIVVGLCVAFVAAFIGVSLAAYPDRQPDQWIPTLLMRALGTLALVLLHVILAIGPLARLSERFTFLLANRRHLGVTLFLVALLHALVVTGWYGGFGVENPLVAVLVRPGGGVGFEFLGFLALLVLLLLAATSHDFWLAFLGPAAWKALHMLVYVAYALVVAHVTLGVLRSETSLVLPALLAAGALALGGLHLAAGTRELKRDAATPDRADDGWVDIGDAGDIPDQRARVVCLGGGARVAVFRDGGSLHAMSNICSHQGGPIGEGEIIDGCATCPWHGYQYNIADGTSPPPYTEKIPTYELRVRGGRVQVNPEPNAPGTPTQPVSIPSDANSEHAG
ncbi:MAG: Rieske 2Fe-2S domain-containing protein [Planctomycetota bacterium]